MSIYDDTVDETERVKHLNIGILANPTSWYLRDLKRAADARGHQVTPLRFDQIETRLGTRTTIFAGRHEESDIASFPANECDAIIVRSMPRGSLEQIIHRMDALQLLANGGTLVVNSPKGLECAIDKCLSLARLSEHGLPIPETVACETTSSAMTAFDALGRDVVVKPLFGSEGKGIVRVSDHETAYRVFRALEQVGSVLYLQRYFPHGATDYRILVLDHRVVGAIARTNLHDFRSNAAFHPRTETYTPSDGEADLAIRAATSCGIRFAGVDLLRDESGQYAVCEVNAVPGWRLFGKTTGIDVASELIQRLETTLLERERPE